jgi:uncharacterized protein (TIGR00255 family)
MIYSMTGFGRASAQINQTTYTVEIKSLNSKQLDLSLRMPANFKEKEIDLRREIADSLIRGKVDVYIASEKGEEAQSYVINRAVFDNYFNQIKSVCSDLDVNAPDVLNAILRLPNVLQTQELTFDEQEYSAFSAIITEAIQQLNFFRKQEGDALMADLQLRIQNIETLNKEVQQLAPARAERVRERILESLKNLGDKVEINNDRFEQEMIFYIEKYDITEEVVRLENHCSYFSETMHSDELSKGKKLGFIAQELGREINTIGSKANDVDVQKKVVQMKDELEKVKEQLNNVL